MAASAVQGPVIDRMWFRDTAARATLMEGKRAWLLPTGSFAHTPAPFAHEQINHGDDSEKLNSEVVTIMTAPVNLSGFGSVAYPYWYVHGELRQSTVKNDTPIAPMLIADPTSETTRHYHVRRSPGGCRP